MGKFALLPLAKQGMILGRDGRNLIISRPKLVGLATVFVILAIYLSISYITADRQAGALADKKAYAKVVTGASDLRRDNNYSKAASQLQSYADQTNDLERQIAALTEAATMYESAQNYRAAIKEYRRVEELNTAANKPEYEAIARCSMQTGDTNTAVSYYKKAIMSVPKDDITSSLQVQRLQAELQKALKAADS